MPSIKDRRRAQSGATLVELLVSLVIASLALALIVGTLSTGLLDSVLAKRNTAADGVLQYEKEAVNASAFTITPSPYSDCFATEAATAPTPAPAGYQTACPGGPFTLRADVTYSWLGSPPAPSANSVQVWTISMVTWPAGSSIGQPLSVYKIHR